MRRAVIGDDNATSLLEYGLLTGAIGLTGLLLFSTLPEPLGDAYRDWNEDIQELSEPPCPPAGC